MLTAALLQAATGCTAANADRYADSLSQACERYQINTPARLAAFLAQIGHESGSLRYVSELWGPTKAQLTYEGRKSLGNTQPGDGERFKGHGLIQVTGRANHAAMRDRLRIDIGPSVPDFEEDPEQLTAPLWASFSAAAFWFMRGCNGFADRGDFEGLTRKINGGTNGLADRLARWDVAKKALEAAAEPTKPTEPTQYMPAGEAPGWEPPQEKPMAPFVIPAVVELAKLIPQLGGLFANSETAQRNVKAAGVVVEAVASAVGASNAQEAVEMVASDSSARALAIDAVKGVWYEITEAGGGGIEGARKAATAYAMPDGPRFWLNPAFWISAVLLAMPMMLLVDVLFVHPEGYQGELRTQIVTGVLLVISIVGGYWLGTSFSSARKTELGARQ